MKRLGSVLLLVPLLAISSGTDGVWTLREHYCIKFDLKTRCGRGSEQYMFIGGTAYYRGDTSEEWLEAGTVGIEGRHVRVDLDEAGFDQLVASRTGLDVSEYIETFSLSYTGTLRGTHIVKGHVRANASLDVEGTPHTLRARGGFTGRRVGDPEPVPVSAELATSRPAAAGSLRAVASMIATHVPARP